MRKINMHSTINYLIYITCWNITKNYIAVNTNLKFTEIFNLLQSFGSRLLQTHRSLRFDTILSSLSATLWALSRSLCLSIVSLVSNLIYNLLLLFIGKLEFAFPWIYNLDINGCNNYLPTNLASKINLTGLHFRIVDSSLLSD